MIIVECDNCGHEVEVTRHTRLRVWRGCSYRYAFRCDNCGAVRRLHLAVIGIGPNRRRSATTAERRQP